jgi:hypothetical protein
MATLIWQLRSSGMMNSSELNAICHSSQALTCKLCRVEGCNRLQLPGTCHSKRPSILYNVQTHFLKLQGRMKRRNVIRRKRFGDGGRDTLKICVTQWPYTRHIPCMKHCYCVKLMSDCKAITNDEYLDSGQ